MARVLTEEEQREIMAFEPDFRLFGCIDLEKSTASKDEGKREIWGLISSPEDDEDGESLVQKSLDFSYLDTKGVIKYEHYPKNSPVNIIGFPHERFTSDKGTVIKGALFEGHAMSDETWSLIRAINKHNKMYPDFPHTLGWSVEGNYGQKKRIGGKFVKGAKIYNIIITPNPILKSTYLKTVQENNAPILKSLSATPVETDVSKKTGGDVIVEDNIDKNLKDTTVGGTKSKKKKKKKVNDKEEMVMKSFENLEDAQKHFIAQGSDEEDALKLAKSLFEEEDIEKKSFETLEDAQKHFADEGFGDEEASKLAKSIFDEKDDELSTIQKSLKGLKDLIGKIGLSKSETEDIDNLDLVDRPGEDEEIEVDVTELVKSIPAIKESQEELIKSVNSLAEGLTEVMESISEEISTFASKFEGIEKSLTVEDHPIGEAINILMKSSSGMDIGDLVKKYKLQSEPGAGGNGDGEFDFSKGKFGEFHDTLDKAVKDGNISLKEQALAENGFRMRDTETVKTVLAKALPQSNQ